MSSRILGAFRRPALSAIARSATGNALVFEKPIFSFVRAQSFSSVKNKIGSPFFPILRRGFAVSVENLESLGDSITSAVLVTWAKESGDSIKEDDVIAIVETDKVTMDIRAKKAGVFTERLVSTGAEILVGNPLYKMDSSVQVAPVHAETTVPAAVVPLPTQSSASAPVAAQLVQVPVPIMGESITTGMLAKWNIKGGDFVKADDIIASIETDKVNVEVHSPHSGVITEMYAAEGDEVNVGKPLFAINTSATGGASSTKAPAAATVAVPVKAPVAAAAPAAAPVAKSTPASAPAKPTAVIAPSAISGTVDRSETRVKMTRMRQRIAQRLKEAQNTAAMLTTFQECDMTNLIGT